MSLLTEYSLADATALIRGELARPGSGAGFSLDGLAAVRLHGIEAAPGHAFLDSDAGWEAVVRSWWGLGLTWGLCVTGDRNGVTWNLVLPAAVPAAPESIAAHLTGARVEMQGDFATLASRLATMPFKASLAGNSGTGAGARLEPALRSMQGREFMFLVLAKAVPRREVEEQIRQLGAEEQYLRDEHLARPGLERDSHAGAARYLSMIEAARNRATTGLQEGAWKVRTLLAAAGEAEFRQAQSLIHSAFAGDGGEPEPVRWQDVADPRALTFLRTTEAAALSRPPQRDLPGFVVETRIQKAGEGNVTPSQIVFATAAPAIGAAPAIAVGRILEDSGRAGEWLELPTADLCRHVLVAGMTGSGKGVTCEQLVLELWRDHRIASLVIEPGMKTGYRRLCNSEMGNDLVVLSIGDPKSRRIAFNPMAAPKGIGVAEHTSALFAVISSAFELVAPMPEVLASAIEQTYRNHGWDLAGLVPEGPPPLFTDLIEEIDRHIRDLGYGPEVTGNIRAGLLLRLRRLSEGPLAPELTARDGIDVASLVSRPTVIELSALPDADSQALVMGFLATQLRHHWRLAGQTDQLRHVTLIEEAHRLLRAVPETAANAARTRANEDLANMLAELRGFGAGLIIVDQTPSALVPSVIANTGTKILHRLDHPADRELAGRAAGLPADEVDILGALGVGEAILRTDRRPRPFRLRMPNPAITYGKLPLPPLLQADKEAGSQVEVPVAGTTCGVCGSSECPAKKAGEDRGLLADRLKDLQAATQRGEDAVWGWADCEVRHQPKVKASPAAPLCFLIALAGAAELSDSTLRRLRSTFEPRTRKTAP